MFSCMIVKKTHYFSHILHNYSCSLPSLIEHKVLDEAPPSEMCCDWLAGPVCCDWQSLARVREMSRPFITANSTQIEEEEEHEHMAYRSRCKY